jgi:hypothetical protein
MPSMGEILREYVTVYGCLRALVAAVVAVTVAVRPHSRFKWPNPGEAVPPGVWITRQRGRPSQSAGPFPAGITPPLRRRWHSGQMPRCRSDSLPSLPPGLALSRRNVR